MNKNNERILIISDIHVPYEDSMAMELLWVFNDVYGPTRIIIAGDLLDFYKASKYAKHPNYGVTIKDELRKGKAFIKKLRTKNPKAVIDYLCGNHDFRLQQYMVLQTPELVDFPEMTIPNLLELEKFGVKWHPVKSYATSFVDNWITVEGVSIGHFNKANQGAGMTVRNLMIRRGGSFVQGHAHRGAIIWRRGIDGELTFGLENPCLYDGKQAPYVSDIDWQMGWSTITHGQPELTLITPDYTFIWGGKEYKRKNKKN